MHIWLLIQTATSHILVVRMVVTLKANFDLKYQFFISPVTSFLEHRPSCIAAATILCAANDLPDFSLITAQHAESWCDGLDKENIMSCYQLMRRIVSDKRKKQPVVLPRFCVTTCSSTTSCNSSSSSSFSSSCKRRKLSDNSWADENKGET